MLFEGKRDKYGYIEDEGVKVYECHFSIVERRDGQNRIQHMKVLVVCKTAEEAMSLCKKEWPNEFELHQVVKRNRRCDLIISDEVINERL